MENAKTTVNLVLPPNSGSCRSLMALGIIVSRTEINLNCI